MTDSGTVLPPVDHLIWGSRDLEREIERVAEWTGVRPAPGGRHPGGGHTQRHRRPGARDVSRATRSRSRAATAPATAVARPGYARRSSPRHLGGEEHGPRATSRRGACRRSSPRRGASRPAGADRWPVAVVAAHVPGATPGRWTGAFLDRLGRLSSPRGIAPKGIRLVDLHAEHPDPAAITELLGRLGLELRVAAGPTPALVASLETPRGRVELR